MSNFVFVLDTNKQPLSPVLQGWLEVCAKLGKAGYLGNIHSQLFLKKAVALKGG